MRRAADVPVSCLAPGTLALMRSCDLRVARSTRRSVLVYAWNQHWGAWLATRVKCGSPGYYPPMVLVFPTRRLRQETFRSLAGLFLGPALVVASVTGETWPLGDIAFRVLGLYTAPVSFVGVLWRFFGRDELHLEGDEIVLRRALGPFARETRAPRFGARLTAAKDQSNAWIFFRPTDFGLGLGALHLTLDRRDHRFGEITAAQAREVVERYERAMSASAEDDER